MPEQITETSGNPVQAEVIPEIPQKKNFLKIVLLVLLGLLVAGGLVYAGMNIGKKQTPPEVVPPVTEPTPTPDPTANWKTYQNEKYGFELKLPENFIEDNDFKDDKPELGGQYIFRAHDTERHEVWNSEFSFEVIGEVFEKIPPYVRWQNGNNDEILWKELGLDLLERKLSVKVQCSFAGDNPWGHYEVLIPLPLGKYLTLAANILTESTEGKEEYEKNQKLLKQILSTFKFLD